MRITIHLIWLCCFMPFISYACSDEERAEMLKAGISPEYIRKSCEDDGLEPQSLKKELSKSSDTSEESYDTKSSMEQRAKNENHFQISEISHLITLMIGGMNGKLDAADGNSTDLEGQIRQLGYFHIFKNDVIAGFRQVSIRIEGTLKNAVSITTGSTTTVYNYLTTYELEGFGFSAGRKFDLPNSVVLTNLTYMTGDASLSVGPFKDLVTGTGDYLAIEVPFLWSVEQLVFGVAPQITIAGGSKNEGVDVALKTAISLQVGATF